MAALSRRQLIRRGAAGLFVVGNLTSITSGTGSAADFARVGGRRAVAPGARPRSWATGYGQLVADPAKLLDLPEGFSYKIVSEAYKPLTGAEGTIPNAFDGAGLFETDGRRFLVRNHELEVGVDHPVVAGAEFTYDPVPTGGTTTIELAADNSVVAEYGSLAGTIRNCAGGVTPWGTWLTCEETEARAGESGLTKDHGFVFEVDPVDVANNRDPFPLASLGRFAHEAVAVDPATGIVYLTEDSGGPNGLLYRATPATPLGGYGSLRDGAVLEALLATDGAALVADLSEYRELGATLTTEWVAVPDPLAADQPTRLQLSDVTRAHKLEGMWWGDGAAFVVSSYARLDDGSVAEHDGQVWRLDPSAGTIELVVRFGVNQDPAGDTFDGPDNITASPWGGLLLCADGQGVQHLCTVGADGSPHVFARNAREWGDEFAGATFTSDGKTLFVNLYAPGVTFAITGPWEPVA